MRWEDGAVVCESVKPLPLVFEEPKGPRGPRPKPPRHLADLTPAERKARLEELGLPGFRARQLSTHYFSRLVDDPSDRTCHHLITDIGQMYLHGTDYLTQVLRKAQR